MLLFCLQPGYCQRLSRDHYFCTVIFSWIYNTERIGLYYWPVYLVLLTFFLELDLRAHHGFLQKCIWSIMTCKFCLGHNACLLHDHIKSLASACNYILRKFQVSSLLVITVCILFSLFFWISESKQLILKGSVSRYCTIS